MAKCRCRAISPRFPHTACTCVHDQQMNWTQMNLNVLRVLQITRRRRGGCFKGARFLIVRCAVFRWLFNSLLPCCCHTNQSVASRTQMHYTCIYCKIKPTACGWITTYCCLKLLQQTHPSWLLLLLYHKNVSPLVPLIPQEPVDVSLPCCHTNQFFAFCTHLRRVITVDGPI